MPHFAVPIKIAAPLLFKSQVLPLSDYEVIAEGHGITF
jgi:hypothetical protein